MVDVANFKWTVSVSWCSFVMHVVICNLTLPKRQADGKKS
jgi:hypothetical protein